MVKRKKIMNAKEIEEWSLKREQSRSRIKLIGNRGIKR